MKTSKNGIDFIKLFEGYRLTAYKDAAGILTIGFGTTKYQTGIYVKKGDKISKTAALLCLTSDLKETERAVSTLVSSININQNQFDALVSFAYNVGVHGLAGSTLLKRLKKNPNDSSITAAFLMWNKIHIDGKLISSEGLKKRRQAEADLYLKK